MIINEIQESFQDNLFPINLVVLWKFLQQILSL